MPLASAQQAFLDNKNTKEASSLSKSHLPRLRQRYDVFISFRGEDTRHTFTGHLYEALCRRGIVTFKDDESLEIGDTINDELMKAIEESSCSIILLSQVYASSKWCLRELAKIVDCMDTRKQLVFPVFYHVLPKDVQTQSGNFKDDFKKHEMTTKNSTLEQEKENADEVRGWKAAMENVGFLRGKEVNEDSNESDVIAEIIEWVLHKLRPKAISRKENLVGVASSLHHIDMLLALSLMNEVRFLGIVGMGGIGKTTIAELVHDRYAHQFGSSCFLRIFGNGSNPSISRDRSNQSKTILQLQQQLLSELLLTNEIKVWDDDYGAERISKLLISKRVLLVIDGIEEDWQLEKLAKSPSWFGPGSRVIITTRNKRLIKLNKVKMLEYNVPLLNRGDALELFKQHATDCIYDQICIDLSNKVLEYAGGLPLALEHLGDASRSVRVKKWEEIKQVGKKKILEKLRFCSDSLESKVREVFLDIACFFKGKHLSQVIEILGSCGRKQVGNDITSLTDKCLMEVSRGKLQMHNVIQEMSRDIVYEQSSNGQSRIWLRKDLSTAFAGIQGLKFIEEISLDLTEHKVLPLNPTLFSEMTNLRILEISQVNLSEDLTYLSNLLALLNWPGYPSSCLPSTFQSDYLVQLYMPSSRLIQLWEGKKKFGMLKEIDLSNSENFLRTPDMSGVPKLERLILRGCIGLCMIHPSITCLDQLVLLDLKNCISLEDFSSNLSCRSLKTLILSCCSRLEQFPKVEGIMGRLAEVYLDGTAIETLDSSIGLLTGLVLLNLKDCKRLSSLPSEIGDLIFLKTLNLKGCSNLHLIKPSLNKRKLWEELDISDTSISHTPSIVWHLKKLKALHYGGLSREVWHSLINSGLGLGSLKYLSLNNCNLVDEDIPKDMCHLSSLEVFDLSGNHFICLSDSLNQLTMLKKLLVNNCHLLQRLPMLPTGLRKVEGRDCISMKDFYNIELHVPSSEAGILTLSFPISDKGQNFKIVESLDSRSTKKFIEVIISNGELYDLSCEMADVFEFFDHIKESNEIEIPFNPEQPTGFNNIYGIVVSTAFHLKNATLNLGKSISCDFCVHLETAMYPSKFLIDVERNCQLLLGTRVWILCIPFQMISNRWRQNSYGIKVFITSNNPNVVVEKCGASVLSQQAAPEFLERIYNKIHTRQLPSFRQITKDCDSINPETCVELEDYSSDGSISPTEGETFENVSMGLLKMNLKSLLRRVFEEVKHCVPFNFPQQEISRWIRHQQKQPRMTIKLPPNISKDKKWIGLALFAVFSVHDINSKTSPYFSCVIESDEQSFVQHTPYLPLPMFLFEDSRQLCIIFEPLIGYRNGRNNSDPLRVSFLDHPEVKIELCGARLVYEQNMEGFVLTILDSILRSGEDLHEFFCQRVMETFLGMQTNLQTPSPEAVTNRQTPSPENGIQELFHSKFDFVLPQHEIPKLFTSGSEENEVTTINLPPSLSHYERNWVGFAICASLTVDELSDNVMVCDRSLKLLKLTCRFKIDSDPVEPEHLHFTDENDLLRRNAKQFIWLLYIPRTAFKVLWRHCSQLEALVSTNSSLLKVRQCGVHLVHNQDMKEIHEIFMEYWHSTSPSAN